MSRFAIYRESYTRFWGAMHVRQARAVDVDRVLDRGLRGKIRYLDLQEQTGIPWWFFMLTHYRESNFDFSTYLGNGEPLNRKTCLVPAGRGPFASFEDGAIDAMKIEGFLNCVDWTIERSSYRLEGFNGYGYHGKQCRLGAVASPYLYGGSTAYGPPEACAGKYIRDHVFSSTFVDPQLGTLTLLKRLSERDAAVKFSSALADTLTEPDDELADGIEWVQKSINRRGLSLGHRSLVEDGRLGKLTMSAIAEFQGEEGLAQTGLPDGGTLSALTRHHPSGEHPQFLSAMPSLSGEVHTLMRELYDQP